jgi:hypothetical protein
MANKDMFAPPTEEELQQDDLFAPPTDQELQSSTEPEMPKMSAADAAVAGGLQGVSFGFADEIKAGIEAPFSDKTYEQLRDEERSLYAAAEKQHPGTYLASDLGAGLLTGGTIAKGAKTAISNIPKLKSLYDKYLGLSKAKQAATAAGLAGTAEGLGRSEAETLPELAQDAVTTGIPSALLGGTVGKISDNLSQKALAKKATEKASDSNIEALQAIGASTSDIADEIGANTSKRASMDTAKGTGNVLLEQDLLKTMDKPQETVTKINSKLDEIYNTKLAVNAQDIDQKLITKQNDVANATNDFVNNSFNTINEFQQAARYTMKDGPALSEGAGTVMNNIIQDLQNAPPDKKLSTAIMLRQQIRDMTNFNKADIPQAQKFYKELYGNINKYIDNLSEMATDAKTMVEFKDANQLYGRLSDAREIAVNNLTKNLSNQKVTSEGDYLIPGLVATTVGSTLSVPAGIAAGATLVGKKVIENKAGKSLTQMYKAYQSQKDLASAKKLMDRSLNYGGKDEVINKLTAEALGGTAAAGVSPLLDKNKVKQDSLRQYTETASPEELQTNAENIRNKYGKSGEQLANQFENMANKDRQGRRAATFSLMQDPNNRRMLMEEDTEAEDNGDL